MLVAFRRGCQR